MIDAPLAQDADVETTSKVFAKLDSTSVSPTLGGEEPQLEMDVDKVSEQDSNIISNVDITCAHGMINPLQAEQCKRVSQVRPSLLHEPGRWAYDDAARSHGAARFGCSSRTGA